MAITGRVASTRISRAVTPATLASGILHTDLVEDLGINSGSGIWSDQSGNSHTATGHAGALPTYTATGGPNNLAYWTCDSTYFDFATNAFASLTAAEVFLVFKRTNPANDGLWNLGATVGSRVPFTGDGTVYEDFGTTGRKQTRIITAVENPNNAYVLYNVTTAAGLYAVRINGRQIFSTTTNAVVFPANGALGISGGAVASTMRVSRFTVFNRALTDTERTALVNYYYLSRYAIPSLT